MSFFMISSSCTPNSCKVDKKSRSIDLSMLNNTWHTSNEPTLKVMTRGSLYGKFTSSFSLNIIGVTEYFLCKLYTPKPISFHTYLAYLLRALLDSLFKHGPLYMEWIICTLSSSQAFYLSTWVVAIRGKLLFFLPSSLQLPSPTRFPKYTFHNNSSILFFKCLQSLLPYPISLWNTHHLVVSLFGSRIRRSHQILCSPSILTMTSTRLTLT